MAKWGKLFLFNYISSYRISGPKLILIGKLLEIIFYFKNNNNQKRKLFLYNYLKFKRYLEVI